MEPLEFIEVANLLNCSHSISINKTPTKSAVGNWDLYAGAYTIHTHRYPFEVLYLHSRATHEGIRRARKEVFRKGETQVVYAPSLSRRMRAHEELLQADAGRFVTLPEYLASFVQEELKSYTDHLSRREPLHYVEPKIETPSGFAKRIPNPIQNFLEDPPVDDSGEGHVAVLLAEPGQGKTFMCDYLVSRLAKQAASQYPSKRFAPIYINAEQWTSMSEGELSSLHKTMIHCFRYFESPIALLDGHEEAFLETTLRAGLFRVVFDGFDEYILRSHGGMTAVEALSGLVKLANSTGTRIVITARTTFWASEINERLQDVEGASDNLFVYQMEPFEYNQAVQYFNKRLGSRGAPVVSRASALYQRLQRGGDQFVGRGFVLSLIADLFERDPTFEVREITGGPVSWLLHALCEREQLRQGLPLTSDQQMSILMQCAIEEVRGRQQTDADIILLVQMENESLDEEAARSCLTKLRTHPLIMRNASRDSWATTQEQARVALVAKFLSGRPASGRDHVIERLSNDANWDPGFYNDLAAMLVEQSGDTGPTAFKSLLERFQSCGDHGYAALPRLAVVTALRYMDASMPSGATRDERTKALKEILPTGMLLKLRFSGGVSKFDFRGTVFSECRFEGVRWAHCRFDQETVFDRCNFRGGSVDHCEEFGRSRFDKCDGDDAGMAIIHAEQIAAGARSYTDSDLRADIRAVVRKFIPKGGFILRTVREDHLRTGPISRSRFVEEVVEEIARQILEFHHISGASERGAHVRADASECVRFFATNNVFTGPLEQAYRRLRAKTAIGG